MSIVKIHPKVTGIWKHSISDKTFIDELKNSYHHLLISNYGPKSTLTLIQNLASSNCITSSSKTLLHQLSFFHPCFKFINALISTQYKTYENHGLYVGILSSGLLYRILNIEDSICHCVLRDICEWIQCSFMNKLNKELKNISFKVDIGCLNQMISIVKSRINSKSYLDITTQEKDHISLKIVEAFLRTFPDEGSNEFGKTHIISLEGTSSLDSFLTEGILYPSQNCTPSYLLSKFEGLQENLKVIIFTVPLSHDLKEKKIIEWQQSANFFEHTFIDYLHNLIHKAFKGKGVNVLLNQMFVHDTLKFSLEKEGILVLDRLGTDSTHSLLNVISCSPVANLSEIPDITDKHIGYLSSIQLKSFEGKNYLTLLPLKTHRCITFVLSGINSCVTEYLKETIESSIFLLQLLMRDSSVTFGAGCFEMMCTCILAQMKAESALHLANVFDASIIEVNSVFDEYIDTFLKLALVPTGGKSATLLDYCINSSSYHLWPAEGSKPAENQECTLSSPTPSSRCACQIISRSQLPTNGNFISLLSMKNEKRVFDIHPHAPETNNHVTSLLPVHHSAILDYLPAKLNALYLAFDGFMELYRVGTCIFDK